LRPSSKAWWFFLIPVRSVVLQATTTPCLHFKPLDLCSRSLTFDFVCSQEDFHFGSLCTLRDLNGTMTSSQPLRLHVNRELERHRYLCQPAQENIVLSPKPIHFSH
jgi:hypothetical protein